MMSLISRRFAELKASNEKALIPFVTAGDPSIEALPDILKILEERGADLIEVGIPFSDPIADGPTIQASSQRALDNGIHLENIFVAVKQARVEKPIIFMGYYNMALRRGLERFAREAKEAGASGVLLSDLNPDEAKEWKACAESYGLDTIFLVAPTSTDARIELACSMSSGFVYCVSRTGVTGAGAGLPQEVSELVERIRRVTELPICVGFGIQSAEDVKTVCSVSDGAVVGSSIVSFIHEKGTNELGEFISDLKQGTR